MKKIVLLFFIIPCFSLFAQSYRQLNVFVPPVTGEGNIGDPAFFYKQLTYELVLQRHTLVDGKRGSDFILNGSIIPLSEFSNTGFGENKNTAAVEDKKKKRKPAEPSPPLKTNRGNTEFFSWDFDEEAVFYDSITEQQLQSRNANLPSPRVMVDPLQDELIPGNTNEFVFFLELINNTTNEVQARQFIVYENTSYGVEQLLAVVVYNLFSAIPAIYIYDEWWNKYLFVNANLLWAPRIYNRVYQSVHYLNFGGKVALEYAFFKFMSVDAGIQVIQDWVEVKTDEEFADVILEIPVAVKFIFKPNDYLLLQPYGGVSINFPLVKTTDPSLLSWFAGLQFGVKAGPGIAVIDPRVSMDFNKSIMLSDGLPYERYMLQIGLGYKMGFIPRKNKVKDK